MALIYFANKVTFKFNQKPAFFVLYPCLTNSFTTKQTKNLAFFPPYL